MKLTTRGRFAVTSMIDIALYGGSSPVRLADIARRQNISVAYLEQIFRQLRTDGLVVSVRGPGGGYRLARAIDQITAGEIVSSVEGHVDATQCHGGGTCRGGAECLAHGLWSELNEEIAAFLNSRTLADIKERYAKRHPEGGPVESPIVFREYNR
ncbi:MAG: Rrf2 family transcriptional regulator [Duodenibacillus sp.]|nr:Rrf2 family transcriptional regulator [Duodenibacillus sp.]